MVQLVLAASQGAIIFAMGIDGLDLYALLSDGHMMRSQAGERDDQTDSSRIEAAGRFEQKTASANGCAPSKDSDQPGHLSSLISLRRPHDNLGSLATY